MAGWSCDVNDSWTLNFSSSFKEEGKLNEVSQILDKSMGWWIHDFIVFLSFYHHQWPSFNLTLMLRRGCYIRDKCSLLTKIFTCYLTHFKQRTIFNQLPLYIFLLIISKRLKTDNEHILDLS